MKYKKIQKNYDNTYVIVCPKKRNKKGFVSSWKMLDTSSTFRMAVDILEYYQNEGFSDATIIYCGADEEVSLPPEFVAQFYRVYFGMNG